MRLQRIKLVTSESPIDSKFYFVKRQKIVRYWVLEANLPADPNLKVKTKIGEPFNNLEKFIEERM